MNHQNQHQNPAASGDPLVTCNLRPRPRPYEVGGLLGGLHSALSSVVTPSDSDLASISGLVFVLISPAHKRKEENKHSLVAGSCGVWATRPETEARSTKQALRPDVIVIAM
jgi:hypothetical protein